MTILAFLLVRIFVGVVGVVVVTSFDVVVLDFDSALKESTVAHFWPHQLLPK
jgi:hypothetical protein